MGLIDESGRAVEPPREVARPRRRPPRVASEIETDIGQLYLRMMEEPVPARLIGILRAGLTGPKP
jgi:hypothetical protein